ncbi:response regulator [Gemmata sp. JC717]|uniref:Response regulator n=1 Tax=Gemmata algarum TaxID=2975278 RepID=A0ABU5ETH5_9BACT|nr:HD domain-containing phosphohydrolase [Gemmata algarum]MDY3552964.1 response regulator [Gemmata algarum]MDY3558259.1 response regulator [Gemmata algarum]
MSEKILFVDDEPNVLAGFTRQLRKAYSVETAGGGAEGLDVLAARGPFAVVVSDMRMPNMDGAQFLARVRERHPDTVRVLLTGYADLHSAIEAVNRGGIFRFLTKPCPTDALTGALDSATAQYRLVTAERELLERTLRGSVQVLGEVLALANPLAFGRAVRVQGLVRRLAGEMPEAGSWQVDVAAVLSQLGCVAVPEAVLSAASRGASLPPEAQSQLDAVPETTRHLLRHIPRLDVVQEIIAYLDKEFDAPPGPTLEKCGPAIPFGARILTAAFQLDTLLGRGLPEREAIGHLGAAPGRYDPEVLSAFRTVLCRTVCPEVREVHVGELIVGDVLAEDLHSNAGVLLLSRGNPITEPLRHRLAASVACGHIASRLRVFTSLSRPC